MVQKKQYIQVTNRLTGKTTRAVDRAIQTLFDSDEVMVVDHTQNRMSNLILLERIKKRLTFEHPGLKYIVKEEGNSFNMGRGIFIRLSK